MSGAAPHLARLRPVWLRQVSRRGLRRDILAGLTGATVVLPQGIAFAAIAGLPPAYGFYTAMVPAVVAAFAGSSFHAVTGPTTAISLMVFGALSAHYVPESGVYIAAAIALALMVGVLQLSFALARMGGLIDFVSHSVMVGFIAAAAIIITVSQLPAALGLQLDRSAEFSGSLIRLADNLGSIDPRALALAAATFGIATLVRRLRPEWPNYLIALGLVTTAFVALGWHGQGIRTVGQVPSVIPAAAAPPLELETLQTLGPAALAIAIVGLLEAASVGRALALRSGQAFDSNREFVGQGLANVAGSLFQCYPSSASFTRSGLNYDAGACTPLSAIAATGFLIAILFAVAPLFAYVPVPAIAGLIILVAIRLISVREIGQIVRGSRSETVIVAVTLVSALLINLEFSILMGVLLSLALFINKTAHPWVSIGAPDPSSPTRIFRNARDFGLSECPQLVVLRVNGPLYFGAVEFVRRAFRRIAAERPGQKHMLFIVKGVGEIDLPAAEMIVEEAERRMATGGSLHLQTRTPRQLEKVARLHVMRNLGRSQMHLSKGDAIREIVPALSDSICATCTARVFTECAGRLGGGGQNDTSRMPEAQDAPRGTETEQDT
ncbi:SulP family inorganic anion transporter [Oceanibium sediminis]|uniref:SulP family inorganic anion transporter n=1 Tax=Oceanibium sediminis TaxID=2026339 RepID=UPI000DD35D79|nr:SulP family inorganic anion transporter [Oceanibium sediminis]